MIISRTPFRMSFFGGGTDYPDWFNKHGGGVISTSIDKFSFISARYLPPFFNYNYRIRYFKQETVNKVDEIKHPVVRESIKFLKIKKGIEIVHNADLPARSGLGSSSTFTVGLINSLYGLNNFMASKKRLANDAIYIEQQLLKESVGSQDQTAAAFGGFNKISFYGKNNFEVDPILISEKRKINLQKRLMLFFTGFSRNASKIAKQQIKLITKKEKELLTITSILHEAEKIIFNENASLSEFGKLLDEQWKVKRSLAKEISNNQIDLIYRTAKNNGALGGKLLGAGGGGFILLYVPLNKQKQVKSALKSKMFVPFKFDGTGSKIIYVKDHQEL